jgi:2-dehydro-3-deoxygalactonokinase
MSNPAFLALDWGTTNLRAWVVKADGSADSMQELPFGVSRIGRGEAAACFHDKVRPALNAERLPAIIAGMAGSTLGWLEVPYVDCPADAQSLAAQLTQISGQDPPVAIVPGLRGQGIGGPDVMRGEETQLIGWLAQDESRRQGRRVVCHPGTHAKWVLVEDGKIVRFITAMTGELFAVMTTHSVLRTDDGPPDDGAFVQGLEAAGDGAALAARLFTARARLVGGGGLKAESVRSYLSGLLIGADVMATPSLLGAPSDMPIALIGDARLCASYKRAMDYMGLAAEVYDGEAAVLSGLRTLFDKSAIAKDVS